jgi:hypothetical protein
LNVVPRGLIPLRTLLSGVSDSAEKVYAINCTQICHCSAGSDTPQEFVLRGIRSRWQIKTPQNQTKMFLELAILFKGTLFENCLYV